jgi:hypothetical protein
VQFAQVNVAQRVRVAHQVALPVVVEVVPGDSNPVAAADGVELTIVVVRADLWREFGFELVVVDPDAGAVLDGDAVVVDDESDGEVADDNVGRIDDRNAALTDLSIFTDTEDGLVAADAEARGQINATFDVDGARCCASDGSDQSSSISDGNHFALLTAGSLANWVVSCVANEVEATKVARRVLLLTRNFIGRKGKGGCQGQTAKENGGDLHIGERPSLRDRTGALGKHMAKTKLLYTPSRERRSISSPLPAHPLNCCKNPLNVSSFARFQDGEMC